MSIFFNTQNQQVLIDEYKAASERIALASAQLSPLVGEAHELLGESRMTGALEELAQSVAELHNDRRDLEARVRSLVEADARTAYLLASRPGQLLNAEIMKQAVTAGWTYGETLLRRELASLLATAGPPTPETQQRIEDLRRRLAVLEAPSAVGNIPGDVRWGFLDPRIGVPLQLEGGPSAERGRDLLIRAFSDSANPDQILPDEFQAFFHDNGNLTIVLPGVTDLSRPQLGYNPANNTPRDLDQSALDSFLSNDLKDNAYGRMVVAWTKEMIELGILERGTPTTIIGHSHGGDTAFDLASDPRFNGGLLDVTHTVSAGYSHISSFDAIEHHTRALSLRNVWDIAAMIEHQAEVSDRATRDRLFIEALEDGANEALDVIQYTGHQTENLRNTTPPTVDIIDTTVRSIGPNGLAVDFDGSLVGAGHHQDNYIDFLSEADEQPLIEFFEELERSGFTDDAVAVSVDISLPQHGARR